MGVSMEFEGNSMKEFKGVSRMGQGVLRVLHENFKAFKRMF